MHHRWVAFVAMLALVASACNDGKTPTAFARCEPKHIIRDGEGLPDCEFEKMGGGSIALRDLRGRPLVLNFWTSWCNACKSEMPAIQRVATAFEGRLRVVGMNGLGVDDEKRSDAEDFIRETRVTYPNAFDVDGLLYANFFGSLGGSPRYPLTLYVDADGIVRKTAFGEQQEADLRENIQKHLGLT